MYGSSEVDFAEFTSGKGGYRDGRGVWFASFLSSLENGSVAPRYHAVADQGVPFREIAEVIGRRLNIPIVSKSAPEADAHFGWFAHFVELDCPASSAWTQKQLGWRSTQAALIPDIDQPSYFETNQETFDQRAGASR